jgi:hypothetical protein
MHLSGSAIVCTCLCELAACPTVWWRRSEEQNFFILIFFNKYLRNEFRQKFFLNLALLSRTSPSDVTYEEITPVHLT